MAKAEAQKPKGKHRAARYTLYVIFTLVVLFVVVNGGLFLLGLGSISIPPAQAMGSDVGMTLNVPNDSFVPINGRIVTNVYDAATGQLLGSGDSTFNLPPSAVSPVTISVPMQAGGISNDPIRVTMDYYVGAYGFVLPFPIRGADVTLPPF